MTVNVRTCSDYVRKTKKDVATVRRGGATRLRAWAASPRLVNSISI